MISKRGSGSGQYIVTQAKRTKAGTFIRGGRLIHNCRSPRVYVRSVGGGIYGVCVRIPVAFLRGGKVWYPVAVGHVYRYVVTGNVTSPVVAETNNEEDRADV